MQTVADNDSSFFTNSSKYCGNDRIQNNSSLLSFLITFYKFIAAVIYIHYHYGYLQCEVPSL